MAVIHNPGPAAAKKANTMNSGKVKICQFGQKRYQTIMPAKIRSEIRKSTKLVMTELAGTIIRGKYTFEIRLALLTRLWLAVESAVEKNIQGSMAAKTIRL